MDSKNNYSAIPFILVRQKWIANYLNAIQWENNILVIAKPWLSRVYYSVVKSVAV